MSNYLQRLVDSALPASEPPVLTPVLKSTSPVFEQNQLFGLPGFQPGERGEPEVMAPVAENAAPAHASLPAPPLALLPREIAQHDARPATPAPSPEVGIDRSILVDSLAPRPAAPDPITPVPQGPFAGALELAGPAPEILEPAPRFDPAPPKAPERPTDRAARPRSPEVAFAPATIEKAAGEAMPPVVGEAAAQPHAEPSPAAPQVVARDVPRPLEIEALRALAPVEPTPEASLPAAMLEPCARPDFREVEPEANQAEPAPPQAPRITIGRVTVELVPDPAPAAKPAVKSRTAAAASVIGPLGNRRMRRRLFALSRF